MDMKAYFAQTPGRGVLATADKEGRVNAAIYSTPHILAEGSVAFLMRERLSHRNVQENPHATYLFVEDGPGSRGVRLYLTKSKEESDPALIKGLMRRHLTPEEDQARGPTFLVTFVVDKVLPLIGADPADIPLR